MPTTALLKKWQNRCRYLHDHYNEGLGNLEKTLEKWRRAIQNGRRHQSRMKLRHVRMARRKR